MIYQLTKIKMLNDGTKWYHGKTPKNFQKINIFPISTNIRNNNKSLGFMRRKKTRG